MDLVSTMIHTDISIFDDTTELQNAADTTPQDNEESDETEALSTRIIHGSLLAPCTLSKLELDHSNEPLSEILGASYQVHLPLC